MTTFHVILKYKCSWKFRSIKFFMLFPKGIKFNLKEIWGEAALQGEGTLGPWSHPRESVLLLSESDSSGSRANSFLHWKWLQPQDFLFKWTLASAEATKETGMSVPGRERNWEVIIQARMPSWSDSAVSTKSSFLNLNLEKLRQSA